MKIRKPVSKRKRFEVFKRDGFRCVYCGRTPNVAVLELDHVVPVSDGGGDYLLNLVTACFDCNRGKAASPLDRVQPIPELSVLDKERLDQLRSYVAWQREMDRQWGALADEVRDRWQERIGRMTQGMWDNAEGIVRQYPMEVVDYAIDVTAKKHGDPSAGFDSGRAVRQTKYFYGVLRHLREGSRR